MRADIKKNDCMELVLVVEERLGELAVEIRHAAVSAFREKLRARRDRLERILVKLRAGCETAQPEVDDARSASGDPPSASRGHVSP